MMMGPIKKGGGSRPAAISLFAGAGGDTLGLLGAGLDVIGFVENWGPAVETYRRNFPKEELMGAGVGGDITRIPDEEFLRFKGKIFLIMATPPCQSFSHAGKKDPNDPRGRLFWHFARAAELIQPRWVVMENVFGIVHRKTDDGRSIISDAVVRALEDIGYTTAVKVLNLADYSVPQKRRRAFFVGSREGKTFEFPEPRAGGRRGIRNIIGFSLEGAVPVDPAAVAGGVPRFCESGSSEAPSGEPHPYLVSKVRAGLLSFAKRISPYHVEVVDLDAPTKTIHAGYRFQPRLFVPMRNGRGLFVRPFTVPELARIQGFPGHFTFCGKPDEVITQIGNAVPPQIVTSIVRKILSLQRQG